MKIKQNEISADDSLNIFDFNISVEGIADLINNNQCNVAPTQTGSIGVVDCTVTNCVTTHCTYTQCTTVQCPVTQCTSTNCTTVQCTQIQCTTFNCVNCVRCHTTYCHSNDCYSQDCSDDGGCFIYGNILTDKGLVSVDSLAVGDRIWGTDNKWHSVVDIAVNTLGNRRAYKMLNGGVVTEDHVIYSGNIAYTPNIQACNHCGSNILEGNNGVRGMYNVPSNISEIDGAALIDLAHDTVTYSPICEDSFKCYLNDEMVLVAHRVQ